MWTLYIHFIDVIKPTAASFYVEDTGNQEKLQTLQALNIMC